VVKALLHNAEIVCHTSHEVGRLGAPLHVNHGTAQETIADSPVVCTRAAWRSPRGAWSPTAQGSMLVLEEVMDSKMGPRCYVSEPGRAVHRHRVTPHRFFSIGDQDPILASAPSPPVAE
jgi:hypothetical protein